jgi:cell wall-associated NlpC family hydrolase
LTNSVFCNIIFIVNNKRKGFFMGFILKNFRNNLIKTLMCTIILASVSISSFAYEGIGKVTGNGVNIRSGEGTAYSIITTVRKGDLLNVIATGNGWTKIELPNGREGYISSDYISLEQKNGTVTGSAVNIRRTPGLDGEIIGLVYSGQTLPIIGQQNDWVNVKYNDTTGWISARYISEVVASTISNPDASKGQRVVEEALKHVGKAYVYGGSGPSAFDCSGFTSYVYKQFGYTLNRTAAGQGSNGVAVLKENLQPGDLVLFTGRGYAGIGHVGIYIGNDKFVHANNSSTGVIITAFSDSSYYTTRFVGGRRIL